jgi:hypothetical protein
MIGLSQGGPPAQVQQWHPTPQLLPLVTVNAADPLTLPEAAVIVAVPAAPAFARPTVTVATDVSDDVHRADAVRLLVPPPL